MHGSDRDASVDRLLRRAIQTDDAVRSTVDCMDADVLAAWADGTLSDRELTTAQAHTARCARCQALLATMVRTADAPAPTVNQSSLVSGSLQWLVPLTVGAAAVVVWIAVRPGMEPSAPVETLARVEQPALTAAPATKAPDAAPAAVPEGDVAREPEPPPMIDTRGDVAKQPRSLRKDAAKPLAKETSPLAGSQVAAAPAAPAPAEGAPPLAPGAATAPVPSEQRAEAAAAARLAAADRLATSRDRKAAIIEIFSADPVSRWRIVDGFVVEHSSDAGVTWTVNNTAAAEPLFAGASPSGSVCWLVGRAGTVLLTTDGANWQKLTFPETVDLVAVTAVDTRIATAVTADGRRFATADGGRTWVRRE